MESASVTPDKKQAAAIPNLVTEDDLKHELGEWAVAMIQKDKVIHLLTAQIGKQVEVLTKQKEEIAKFPAIMRSNNQLDEKNHKLADTLRDVRGERDTAVADKAVAIAALAKVETAAVARQAEVDRLQGLYDGSQTERNQLNDTVDEAVKEIEGLQRKIAALENKAKARKKRAKAA